MTVDDDIEAIYNAIRARDEKYEKYLRYTNLAVKGLLAAIFLLFGLAIVGYKGTNLLIIDGLLFLSAGVIGTIYNPEKVEVFNSGKEALFYYLYDAWGNRFEEGSKFSMTYAIREIESQIEAYELLQFTEELVETFTLLKENLEHYVYPYLGIESDIKDPNEAQKSASIWDSLKKLSISIYQNAPLTSIGQQVGMLPNGEFGPQYDIKLMDESEPLSKKVRNVLEAVGSKYNKSLQFRFIAWSSITTAFAYLIHLIWKVKIGTLLTLAVIPILAPYYLVDRETPKRDIHIQLKEKIKVR